MALARVVLPGRGHAGSRHRIPHEKGVGSSFDRRRFLFVEVPRAMDRYGYAKLPQWWMPAVAAAFRETIALWAFLVI